MFVLDDVILSCLWILYSFYENIPNLCVFYLSRLLFALVLLSVIASPIIIVLIWVFKKLTGLQRNSTSALSTPNSISDSALRPPMPILCFDVETGGYDVTSHPLLAIGTCLLDQRGNKEKKRFVFNFDRRNFAPAQKKFWEGANQLKLRVLEEESKKTTIHEFAEYVDSLDMKYPHLLLLSDNPAFDVPWIDYLFVSQLHRKPLQYRLNKDNGYRQVVCQNSFLYSALLSRGCKTTSWVKDNDVIAVFELNVDSTHDHLPENDAEHMLDLFVGVMNKL